MTGKTRAALYFFSFSLFFISGIFLFISKSEYQKYDNNIPMGSSIGPFSIGGLSLDNVDNEMVNFYKTPVDLMYEGSIIRVTPDEMGFTLNTNEMKNTLNIEIKKNTSNSKFLSSLFNNQEYSPISISIKYSIDEQKIYHFLQNEIVPRYDELAQSKQPSISQPGFYRGHSGRKLDIESSIPVIKQALISTDNRTAKLVVTQIPEPKGLLNNLKLQIINMIDTYQDEGQLTEVYLIDPVTNETLEIGRRNFEETIPDVSFTAASTMKIPIMISSYVRMEEEPDATVKQTLSLMITESKNDQTDWMMKNIIGGDDAPLTVTDDLKKLGFQNTFLAGYFYMGAPLLSLIKTPANSRTDINLKPDSYNQTTAKDMGTLLYYIYQCDKTGTGPLINTFGEKITQHECNEMIDLLKNNHLPYLISAGVPDGTPVAHKHGWIEESDGFLHTMGNVAVVYSPLSDYILSIYTWHPTNLIFDNGNILFSHISSVVYGYFNPSLTKDKL